MKTPPAYRCPQRKPHTLKAAFDRPEVVNYLTVFEAWLTAGPDRNDKFVADLKALHAHELIGDIGGQEQKPRSPERHLLRDVLQTLIE